MSVTPCDVMRETRCFFPCCKLDADWSLTGGTLSPMGQIPQNGWIALVGADGADGVYQVTNGKVMGAADAVWHGTVWVLAPTADFLRLCTTIDAWVQAQPRMGLAGEKFGEYSMTAARGSNGLPLGWQQVFARELAVYRRMFTDVMG